MFYPVAKFVNKGGEEGIRYAWKVDDLEARYVESGAFLYRTKLRLDAHDELIKAYTASVSLGCILAKSNSQCKFCVTGNTIPFGRLLTSREIALQNTFMVLDDTDDLSLKEREFAYMGQGEPGLNYDNVKRAIIGTDKIMEIIGTKTYRHIFATSGIPNAVKRLTDDYKAGDYGTANILLHISLHAVDRRNEIMPIGKNAPIEKVIEESRKYAEVTKKKVVVNFLLFKNAMLSGAGPITTATDAEMHNLTRILDPEKHRIILCEYNQSSVGTSDLLTPEEVDRFEKILKDAGFEVKRFISFGKNSDLACGLLGGLAVPNLNRGDIEEKFEHASRLVDNYVEKFN